MPPIIFPPSSAPGKNAIESAGRLVNAYAERLPQGAPAQYVIRRTPGLTEFSAITADPVRGLWFDGRDYVYAALGDELYRIDGAGAETLVGSLAFARPRLLGSYTDTQDATIYSFPDVPFGLDDNPARRIVVAVVYDATNDAAATVTIGGVAATEVVAESSAVALFIAHVPDGREGEIVVTYASAASRAAIGVWRIDGINTNTATATASDTDGTGAAFASISTLATGAAVIGAARSSSTSPSDWQNDLTAGAQRLSPYEYSDNVESALRSEGSSAVLREDTTINISAGVLRATATINLVLAGWNGIAGNTSGVTFAKNNATTPDQVLCIPGIGAFTFTSSIVLPLDVNGDLANSVCFGEGFFFLTTPDGRCYASGVNATTISSLDVIRAEARPEPLVRGVFWNGDLYLFGETHTEVWASGGNPNPTGFPLNRTTVVWRGLVGTLAVCGFEDGFEGGLVWVADDNSVRMMQGYQPATISTADVERAIEDCSDRAAITCAVYDVDGHACVVIDLVGEGTWVYDLTEGGNWHERDTAETGAWRATGNSVKAFGKWLVGDRLTGNIYEVDKDATDDGGLAMPWIVESIAMEAFPQRLQVPRVDLNFVSGVGSLSDAIGGNDQYTKVLIHMDGADGSTTFTDVNAGGSAHVWTANGNAQIDTADFPFGTGALLCDGTGDYLSTPDHADFTLGSSDFAVDFRFKNVAATGTQRTLVYHGSGGVAATVSVWVRLTTGGVIEALLSDGSSFTALAGTTVFSDTLKTGWHHGAFVRHGNTLVLLIDGVQEAAGSFSGSVVDPSGSLFIGGTGGSTTWNGWIAEVRLSVGVDRWATNFTPPNLPYSGAFAAARDPKVLIQWSDDGGHRWSDPVERKLGEAGRYLEHVRVNRLGLTGTKGRRFRLRVDDQVYVGLLAGSMEVSGRP